MSYRNVWVPALCAALLCSACRASFDDLRKKHRAAVETKLAQAEKIGKLLDQTPLIASDDVRVAISAGPRPSDIWGVPRMRVNVSVSYQEALADLTAFGPTVNRLRGTNLLNVCGSLLRNGKCPESCNYEECSCTYSLLESLLERCAKLEYLIVVRTLEYGAPAQLTRTTGDLGRLPDRPRSATADLASPPRDTRVRDLGVRDRPRPDARRDARVESWTFKSGLMRAEVHVFEMATGRRLGGFRIRAENDGKVVRSIYLNEAMSPSAASAAIEADFNTRCHDAITFALQRRVPGAYF